MKLPTRISSARERRHYESSWSGLKNYCRNVHHRHLVYPSQLKRHPLIDLS